MNKYCSEIFNNVEAEAKAEAEAEAMPSKIVEAEAEAEAMLFEMVEAEAEAVNSQICLLEAEAEAVQKSTASASLIQSFFLVACYATLHPAWLVGWLVPFLRFWRF